jgi:hypothetical protein
MSERRRIASRPSRIRCDFKREVVAAEVGQRARLEQQALVAQQWRLDGFFNDSRRLWQQPRTRGSDRGAARPARELLKKTVESANSFPCSPFAT